MKKEDFNRLKEICEREGFDIVKPWDDGMLVVKKKDPWEGVEFVDCIVDLDPYTDPKKGKIYKVSETGIDFIVVNGITGGLHKSMFKPSTEEAYIEQLKKTAYEKFGEIREGDKFASLDDVNRFFSKLGNIEWDYYKGEDQLFHYNICIYQQGKWATKLPERVEVEFHDWEYRNSNTANVSLIFHIPKWSIIQDKDDIGEYLAKQLENYLNDETGA